MSDWEYDAIGYEEVTAENVRRLFDYCSDDYNATTHGCQAIIDKWLEKANRFDDLFRNIPGYVEGKHMIVLRHNWLRQLNKADVKMFANYIYNLSQKARIPSLFEGKTKGMWADELERQSYILNKIQCIIGKCPNIVDYNTYVGVQKARDKASKVYDEMEEYTSESVELCNKLYRLYDVIYYTYDQFVTEETANKLNDICPKAKIVSGQKMSRSIKKVCSILLDNFSNFDAEQKREFEQKYAAYADAINPFLVEKPVCISWNLFDFLTMSQGNSWQSCHDIFEIGCYSSGTLSYAEDMVSVVVYMLPDNYETAEQPLWNLPKVKRQMFHIYEDGHAFIQGRLYPDDQTDHGYGCDFSSYKEWREMMQDIVSKAFDVPNLWKNIKGHKNIRSYTRTLGTNYTDYTHYENCNLSYSCDEDKIGIIEIGHLPICPSCGNEHDETENCTCGECRGDKIRCEDCGELIDEEDSYYINGHYYCRDCVTYCDYHGEYEHISEDDMTSISGYGLVCETGLDILLEGGYAYECDECENYVRDSDSYEYYNEETEETFHFCCSYCRDRYVEHNFPRMA